MTSHPKDAGERLFDTMAACEKVAPVLHLPFQSGSAGCSRPCTGDTPGNTTWTWWPSSGPGSRTLSSPPTSSWAFPGRPRRSSRRPSPSSRRCGLMPCLPFSSPPARGDPCGEAGRPHAQGAEERQLPAAAPAAEPDLRGEAPGLCGQDPPRLVDGQGEDGRLTARTAGGGWSTWRRSPASSAPGRKCGSLALPPGRCLGNWRPGEGSAGLCGAPLAGAAVIGRWSRWDRRRVGPATWFPPGPGRECGTVLRTLRVVETLTVPRGAAPRGPPARRGRVGLLCRRQVVRVLDRRRLAPAAWVPARSRAGIQAFSRESPDAKSRGMPPPPLFYGPLVATRWFWRLWHIVPMVGLLRGPCTCPDLGRFFV